MLTRCKRILQLKVLFSDYPTFCLDIHVPM